MSIFCCSSLVGSPIAFCRWSYLRAGSTAGAGRAAVTAAGEEGGHGLQRSYTGSLAGRGCRTWCGEGREILTSSSQPWNGAQGLGDKGKTKQQRQR
jgi:hypothetical protein